MPSVSPGPGKRIDIPDLYDKGGRLNGWPMFPKMLPFYENFERGEAIISKAPQLYIDLDVEADGKPGYGSLLSIGAVATRIVENEPHQEVDPHGPSRAGRTKWITKRSYALQQDSFYRELKPTSDLWIPSQKQFCEEHNLQRERLMDEGMEPADAMKELAEWEKQARFRHDKHKSVLVAFNASFDYPWIDLEMIKAKRQNPFGIAGYCIKSLAQNLASGYDWNNTSKNKLPEDIMPEGDFTHNALEDAVYQSGMHHAMVGKIATLYPELGETWRSHGEE